MPKKVLIGIVTSDKAQKTRRVEVARQVKHPKYGKYIKRKTVCHVHDENEETQLGDQVEIRECRPLSKTKTWELVRVIRKSTLVDVAAMRAELRAQARAQNQQEIGDAEPTEGSQT